jgi:hypothetical protein
MIPLGFSGSYQLSAIVESLTSPIETFKGFPGTRNKKKTSRKGSFIKPSQRIGFMRTLESDGSS